MRVGPQPPGRARLIRRGVFAILLTATASGCGLVGPSACTDVYVYGIVVTAIDAESGTPVVQGLRGVTIRDSNSVEMEVFGNMLNGAGEQAGTFTVVVTAPGYEFWTKTDVRVTEDECHVRPVGLTAELVRMPAI